MLKVSNRLLDEIRGEGTYSAAILADSRVRVVFAVLIFAFLANGASELDVEGKLLVRGRLVGENRGPGGAVLVAQTQVHRSPVAIVMARVTPLAGSLRVIARGVDVELSRGVAALPLVVGSGIGVEQLLDVARRQLIRDVLGLGTWPELD